MKDCTVLAQAMQGEQKAAPMTPRNVFPAKVTTSAFFADFARVVTPLLESPYLDKIVIVIDADYTDRLGGKYLTLPRCIFVSPQEVDDDFLKQIDPVTTHFVYVVECASDGLPVVRKLVDLGFKYSPVGGAPVGSYAYDNRLALETVESQFVYQNLERYGKFEDPGTPEDFANLCQVLETTRHIGGDVVEVGCYRGSSGSVLLDYARRAKITRRFYFLDTFDGFSYEAAKRSSDAMWQGTHATEGLAVVRDRLLSIEGHGSTEVNVLKANIMTDALPGEIQSIAVANIDVDLYDAVLAGLTKVAPFMAPGGIMICEDAGHTPNLIGARLALEEFLDSETGNRFTPVFMTSGQVMLVAR